MNGERRDRRGKVIHKQKLREKPSYMVVSLAILRSEAPLKRKQKSVFSDEKMSQGRSLFLGTSPEQLEQVLVISFLRYICLP